MSQNEYLWSKGLSFVQSDCELRQQIKCDSKQKKLSLKIENDKQKKKTNDSVQIVSLHHNFLDTSIILVLKFLFLLKLMKKVKQKILSRK